jgi:hypothetical protein
MENVIAVQEHPEHIRSADNADAAVWHPERSQGLLERSTGRIPEQRLFIRRVSRDGGDFVGQDQATAQLRTRLSLMRVAPMHHHVDPVKSAFEELLIGPELERVRHDPFRIREHAILGDNGITLDATRLRHSIIHAYDPPTLASQVSTRVAVHRRFFFSRCSSS